MKSDREIIKEFTNISDAELSLADIQWLIKNFEVRESQLQQLTLGEEGLKNEIDKAFYPDGHFHKDLIHIQIGDLIIVRDLLAKALSHNGKPSYRLLERRLSNANVELKRIHEALGSELPVYAQIVKLKNEIADLKKILKNGWSEEELEKILPKKKMHPLNCVGECSCPSASYNQAIDDCKQALLSQKEVG